ncbi:MAG: tetratricopeptide repeat protein [Elusimicrobiota bacterium]
MNVQKIFKYLVIALTVVLILLFLIVKVEEFDVWLHLSSGRYILNNFKVPQLDPFSYTAAHREYVDSHWLYQVFLYLFYSTMGFFGLFIYQLLVIGAIFYVLFRVGMLRVPILSEQSNLFYVSATCIFLTLLISNHRFLYRPEMFSYLFAVLFVLILESRKKLYFLPIVQILWTNTHGFFIFGPIIIGCYFIGELICKKQLVRQILLLGILCILACILACFINPYGYKLAAYPFLLFTEIGSKASPYMKSVSELTPTLFAEMGRYGKSSYFLLILISAVSFFARPVRDELHHISNRVSKKFNFSRFFVYLIFLYISWTTVRNTVFFAFVGSLIAILNFNEIKELKIPVDIKTLKIFENCYLAFLIVVNILIAQGVVTNKYFRQEMAMQQFGIGKIDMFFPIGAVDFIKRNNINGNIFNDALMGGYFIWNCWPERKCFVDGKMEIYGEEFLAEYKSVIDNPDVYWQRIADKYKIDYVLLHPLSPHSKNIIKHLYKNKKWELAYFDEGGVVFIKRNQYVGTASTVQNSTNKFVPTRIHNTEIPGSELRLGTYSKYDKQKTLLSYANFFFFTEQYKNAQSYYAEVLKLDPDFPEAYIGIGAVFMIQKKYNDAEMCYQMAIKKSDRYAEPFFGLAQLEVEKGNYSMALKFLQQTFKRRQIYPNAQFLFCYVCLKTGQYDETIRTCKKMLLLTPTDEKIYNLLGTAYFLKKNCEEAIEQYKKAICINPEYAEAKRNFLACIDKMNERR